MLYELHSIDNENNFRLKGDLNKLNYFHFAFLRSLNLMKNNEISQDNIKKKVL